MTEPDRSSLVSRSLICRRSGLPLAEFQILIQEGYSPLLQEIELLPVLHPFYSIPAVPLLNKLRNTYAQIQDQGFEFAPHLEDKLALLISCLMHSLQLIKQEQASLPSNQIALSSAPRLIAFASWYLYVPSRRIPLPWYHISKQNQNLEWDNFRFWLDEAFNKRTEWETKRREREREEELRQTEVALDEIRHREILKKLDLRKIWRWITLQCDGKVPAGRLETWKELFLTGDVNCHEWLSEDVQDLQVAILDHCDPGNEIMYFIRERLSAINSLIRDFYGGYVLLGHESQEEFGESNGAPTSKELDFLRGFDEKVEILTELPSEPRRVDFATQVLFLKAQANWNILRRRWELHQKRNAS